MTIHNVYSILDIKSAAYGPPFLASTHLVASRNFADMVSGPRAVPVFAQHPEDFVLFFVGKFDDVGGQLLPVDERYAVSNATEFTDKRAA